MKGIYYKQEILTVPNILSALRIFIIVPLFLSIMDDNYILASVLLVLSGISDMLDGIIARKFNQVTRLGKMFDPTADKLTLMAVMICVGLKFPKIYPFMIILILKEVAMLLAGVIILKRKQTPPAAKWYGKVSTVVFYISVITIIGLKAVWNLDLEWLNVLLMSITALCMIYSVVRYFNIFMSIIKLSDK